MCAIKNLIAEIVNPDENSSEDLNGDNEVVAYIEMHGHSRKKNVFIYGPYVPLHSDKYFKMRILPKLISEETP